jgi:hypothetical protein
MRLCPLLVVRHWEVTARVQKGFSFVFLDVFLGFFDLFADLARACLGSSFLERPSRSCEVVRVRMDTYGSHNRTLSGPVRP